MSTDPNLFHAPPPGLTDHPLFSGKNTVGLMTADAPRYPTVDIGSNDDLERHLTAHGLKFEKTHGSYGGPETSYIIHGPTREQMYDLGHRAGQEAIVYSQNGQHELTYTHGPHAGKYHPSLPLVRFAQQQPDDYYTHLPGKGYMSLHFDFDKMHDSPVKHTIPAHAGGPSGEVAQPQLSTLKSELRATIARALKKAMATELPPKPHPHAYPWHEGHHSYHERTKAQGILLTTQEFIDRRGLAKKEEPAPAGMTPPAPAGPKPHPTNDQAAGAGVSTYAKYAAPYGSVNKGAQSDLKHYPLDGVGDKVKQLVKDHGFQTYYAGGKHGKADLNAKNYTTGHLMVWDPSAGSGGDFGHQDYTDAWRQTHELAHALTLPDLNAKYGEGRRMGGLGKMRSLREAKRSVEWEHLAAHKQRELCRQIGVEIPDEAFNREYNTVMHDAVHRAVTGKFTEPSEEGFVPHGHAVPLSVAHGMLDEAAQHLGLQSDHDLLRKFADDLRALRRVLQKRNP